MVLFIFYHEIGIFNPFDVVLNRFSTDSRLVMNIYFENDLTPKNIFILIFRALIKTRKNLKRTFVSFLSFDNSKKGTLGVFFQPFSNSTSMKIFPSTCLFELVKVNELISTQYQFNPFPE